MTEFHESQVTISALLASSLPAEACLQSFEKVYQFLHGELPDSESDEIRQHLAMCEHCMDEYELEQCISSMLRRCYSQTRAPETLRVRISASLTITEC